MKTRSLRGASFFVAVLSCCILVMADYAEAQRSGGGRGGGSIVVVQCILGFNRARNSYGRRRWYLVHSNSSTSMLV